MTTDLQVRPMRKEESPLVVDYFLDADHDYLHKMGVEPSKLPERDQWISIIEENINERPENQKYYYLIWELDGVASGHCNINLIKFGEEAHMHLHLWNRTNRGKGLGTQLVKMCVPIFFDMFQLKRLYCAPNADNAAPNCTLISAGFTLVEQVYVVPGWINYLQHINRYKIEM